MGLLSAFFAARNNILVYPTGIVSTCIFVYILAKAGLLGDMIINAYYFVMSIYGWFYWSRKVNGADINPITTTSLNDSKWGMFIFLGSIIFIWGVYSVFDKWTHWTAYVDTFTTALFFVGMWFMAKRKLEHWLFWIVGNTITVPLYYHKELLISSFQYVVLTLIAILGYRAWKKQLNNPIKTSSR